MSYVFKNYIESLIDNNILFYNGDLDITKGMASFTGKFKLINLIHLRVPSTREGRM